MQKGGVLEEAPVVSLPESERQSFSDVFSNTADFKLARQTDSPLALCYVSVLCEPRATSDRRVRFFSWKVVSSLSCEYFQTDDICQREEYDRDCPSVPLQSSLVEPDVKAFSKEHSSDPPENLLTDIKQSGGTVHILLDCVVS